MSPVDPNYHRLAGGASRPDVVLHDLLTGEPSHDRYDGLVRVQLTRHESPGNTSTFEAYLAPVQLDDLLDKLTRARKLQRQYLDLDYALGVVDGQDVIDSEPPSQVSG